MGLKKIGIVDYGSGNYSSVYNAVQFLGFAAVPVRSPAGIFQCSHLILPGVGAFAAAVHKLKRLEMFNALRSIGTTGIPFLGICIGMQLLADWGMEGGEVEGLGLVPGQVARLNVSENLRLPHIGWNELAVAGEGNQILAGLESRPHFYFVHSYAFNVQEQEHVLARSAYGETFAAMVQRENVYGVQFHPEKSQKSGLQLLKNFCELS